MRMVGPCATRFRPAGPFWRRRPANGGNVPLDIPGHRRAPRPTPALVVAVPEMGRDPRDLGRARLRGGADLVCAGPAPAGDRARCGAAARPGAAGPQRPDL